MARHKIKDPKAIICIFCFCICLTAVLTLFIIGGIFYSDQHPKVLHYANSMCRVDSRSWKAYQCKARYYTYSCYGPIWEVHHGEMRDVFATVEGDTRYRSFSEALNKAYEYQIGSSYSCWYDQRNPSIAQWEQPSTTVAVILLSCGGLAVLLSALFLFLGIRLVKQEILQNNQNMNPYSYANPYTKQ